MLTTVSPANKIPLNLFNAHSTYTTMIQTISTRKRVLPKSLHTQAIKEAERITGAKMNEDGEFVSRRGRVIAYRKRFNDWVSWTPGQLEGTLRGDDARFIAWAKPLMAEPKPMLNEYSEDQVEWMRAELIQRGCGGCFGSTDTPAYWSGEVVVQTFEKNFPGEKVPQVAN